MSAIAGTIGITALVVPENGHIASKGIRPAFPRVRLGCVAVGTVDSYLIARAVSPYVLSTQAGLSTSYASPVGSGTPSRSAKTVTAFER